MASACTDMLEVAGVVWLSGDQQQQHSNSSSHSKAKNTTNDLRACLAKRTDGPELFVLRLGTSQEIRNENNTVHCTLCLTVYN